jgi:ABC-type phosphate/phosphonate transport system substrate-binding protein
MTPMLASLPMYDADRPAVERLWQGIAAGLHREGLRDVPDALVWPGDDLDAHWLHPGLLLSQTCGYPIVDHLQGKVQLVGTFRHTADGCDGIRYRSKLVVREDDPGERIADFRGRTAAYNAANSQSGYNSLLALVAPLAEGGRFFGRAVASGAHVRSIELVKSGAADIAAIDCISYAAFARASPESLRGLRVIGITGAAPGLPLITAAGTPPHALAALRRAVAGAFGDAGLDEAREAL